MTKLLLIRYRHACTGDIQFNLNPPTITESNPGSHTDPDGKMISQALVYAAYIAGVALSDVPPRDCFTGPAPFCNNSLAEDPTCRGVNVDTIDVWKRMDCDYAIYNVPAQNRDTNKWLVVHAGVCDSFTEELGDYFAPSMDLNLFGLRQCGGFQNSLCYAVHGFSTCAALHVSWFLPQLDWKYPATDPNIYAQLGFGFNPPDLVDIFHTPDTNMLFLHEYGDTNKSYNWWAADGCNMDTKPLYICLAGLDPDYDAKFLATKLAFEQGFNKNPTFPCRVEVHDANQFSKEQNASIPCSGLLLAASRENTDASVTGGDLNGAPNWTWEMPAFVTEAVSLASEIDPAGRLVGAFKQAINIALCKTFRPGQLICEDDD